MMHWYGNGMGSVGWVVMVVMMVAFGSLIVLAGVMIFRTGRGGVSGGPNRGALEILEERFARGEIDREEYEARRAVLRDSAR